MHTLCQLITTAKRFALIINCLTYTGMHIPVLEQIYDDPDALLGPAVSGLATWRSFKTLDTPDTFHAA